MTVSETLRAAVTQSAGCDVLRVCVYIYLCTCVMLMIVCVMSVFVAVERVFLPRQLVDCSLKTVCVACCR